MDIKRITDSYAVSPQIAPQDVSAIREAGFVAILCNRPDAEVDDDVAAQAIRAAAEAEGLAFHDNPVVNGALSQENISRQRAVIEAADGPVLAYCRSGTRSTIVWALGQAGLRPTDEIVRLGNEAGYDLAPLGPQIEAMATHRR